MTAKSRIILWITLAATFGGWLMQHFTPTDTSWMPVLTPMNVGSLLVGLTATLAAAFGVNANGNGNGSAPKKELSKDIN